MSAMAAACGVMIVLLGFWSAGHSPTPVQMAVQITCLVGGLILCFLSVVLARLGRLARQFENAQAQQLGPARAELVQAHAEAGE